MRLRPHGSCRRYVAGSGGLSALKTTLTHHRDICDELTDILC